MVLEYPGAHNFTVSLFLVGHPIFSDAKMALFQFYTCKMMGPRVRDESKGGWNFSFFFACSGAQKGGLDR